MISSSDWAINWEPTAVIAASRYLDDDPDGLRSLITAIDALADEPRPPDSAPFGSPDVRRLRSGRYRVLYRISEAIHEVLVTHVGRSA